MNILVRMIVRIPVDLVSCHALISDKGCLGSCYGDCKRTCLYSCIESCKNHLR